MMRAFLILLFTALSFTAFSQQSGDKAIRTILAQQAAAWNKGDIETYMKAGYWQNDSLLFIGKNGPTYGFDSTLARYKRSYPDASRMGQLTFTILEVRMLAPAKAFVVGKWALARKAGDIGGSFTLLWEKKAGRWVIVADHSS